MRRRRLSLTLLCGLSLPGCTGDPDGPAMQSRPASMDASTRPPPIAIGVDSTSANPAKPHAGTLPVGPAIDGGPRADSTIDAGEDALPDGSITYDDAGRKMRRGHFDLSYPTCNAPTCGSLDTACSDDADCCQAGEWADRVLCVGNFCGVLLSGFEPVWHDPIPVCADDGGVSRR